MMTRGENVIVYGTAADGIRAWRGLAWRDYNWNGEIIKECKAGSCVPEFGHDHDDEIAATIANMIRPYDCDIYIRFGELPRGGRSTNWATGETEAGISAYDTTYDGVTGCYKCYGALQGAEINYLMRGANIYFVTGDVVGTGSDGEPLLANVNIIAEAHVSENGYKAI